MWIETKYKIVWYTFASVIAAFFIFCIVACLYLRTGPHCREDQKPGAWEHKVMECTSYTTHVCMAYEEVIKHDEVCVAK